MSPWLSKRDKPARVHTGRAVRAQLAAARTPEQRRVAFMANLGDGFFLRGGRTVYSDGGPARGGSKSRPGKNAKRRARRRDLERRRRTPGGAYLP